MKVQLFPFQQTALAKMRKQAHQALSLYNTDTDRPPQIISFTAPTGAGKTIIMSGLLENIYFGGGILPAHPGAVTVWLSDDPNLNEQSKEKIETRADKFTPGQCVTISEDSFDCELLEDGKIYFLNTQKLSKTGKLTKHSDNRQYTIWETLQNTILEKSDRLYFIIDEAHRGAKPSESGKATSIMQKFIFGDESVGLSPMPLVIWMSATIERFNSLIGNSNSTVHKTTVSPTDVRRSGLLKEWITINYPDQQIANKDMAVLQAATDEWQDKWKRWFVYCQEQHYAHVYPIMLVQVENGTAGRISNTDLADCISKIESRVGTPFKDGEIVHAFGSKGDLEINGRKIPYIEPASISSNRDIKVVFFKDSLSTGWDCPRAETMMSFRHASDSTYVAQLLGRMIRTPMQMRIEKDETLNDVKLFLPHFDKDTVSAVIEALKNIEGGELPSDISGQQIGEGNTQTLTVHRPTPITTNSQPVVIVSSAQNNTHTSNLTDIDVSQQHPNNVQASTNIVNTVNSESVVSTSNNELLNVTARPNKANMLNSVDNNYPSTVAMSEEKVADTAGTQTNQGSVQIASFDRYSVMNAINDTALLNFSVRSIRVKDFFYSYFALCRLLMQSGVQTDAYSNAVSEIGDFIENYIEELKSRGEYDGLVRKVQEFKMASQIFDALGESVENLISSNLFTTTDSDIERQFQLAESKLGNEGIGNKYVSRDTDLFNVTQRKINVILFASNHNKLEQMQQFSKARFYHLKDMYRLAYAHMEEKWRKRYETIVADGDPVSQKSFHLPDYISIQSSEDGTPFFDHLFVNEATGCATFKLTSWEAKTLEEERQREGFVTWLRNPARGSWSLCIPYVMNNENKPMYPDFIVVRKVGDNYILDLLEPHNSSLTDNLAKAKGLAEYSQREQKIGRVQLIREIIIHGVKKLVRLELNNSLIRDKVIHATSNEELDHLFDIHGISES